VFSKRGEKSGGLSSAAQLLGAPCSKDGGGGRRRERGGRGVAGALKLTVEAELVAIFAVQAEVAHLADRGPGRPHHRFERHVLGRRVVRVPRRPANVAPINMQHADGVASEADAVELKRRRGR
jgi:hypothetical protein